MENEGQVTEPVVETPVEVPDSPEAEKVEKVYTQKEVDEIAAKVKKNATYRAKKEKDAYYKGLLEGKEQNQPARVAQTDKMPERDSYLSYEEFMDAKTKYIAKTTVKEETEAVTKEAKARETETKRDEQQQVFHSKLIEKYPDIESKLEAIEDYELPGGVGHAIVTSDYGPELVNYLVENPKEAERISKLASPVAIREIGRLEARFDAKPPPVKTSNAPTPIKPVQNTTTGDLNAEPDPKKNGGQDWYDWRQKQVHKKKS